MRRHMLGGLQISGLWNMAAFRRNGVVATVCSSLPPGNSGTFFFQAARSSDPTFQSGTFTLTNGACLTIQ